MKLPDELDKPYPCSDAGDWEMAEAIVRHCAKVCEDIGKEHNDPFQSMRCHNGILREFGLVK